MNTTPPEHGEEAEAPLVPETKTDGVEGERNSCTFTTLAFPLGRAAPEASPELQFLQWEQRVSVKTAGWVLLPMDHSH